MLHIRPLTTADADIAAAAMLLTSAFRSETHWDDELRRYLNWQSDGWILAETISGGQPVAMVGAMDYTTYAYIGMMAVHEEWQRRGVGLKVMEHILRWLDERGCPIVLLDATPSGIGLYNKLGFTKVGIRAMFDYRAPNRPPPPSLPTFPITTANLEEVIAFDRLYFGGDRHQVIASLLSELPDRALLTRDQHTGEMTGYLFANQRRIAPFIARSTEAAETLLCAALQFKYSVLPGLITPFQNKSAIDLLVRYGFVSLRSCVHMQRGNLPHPQHIDNMYAQFSYAVG